MIPLNKSSWRNIPSKREKNVKITSSNWTLTRTCKEMAVILATYHLFECVQFFKPIKCQCCHHIETSRLICCANQLTGFYMKATLALNGLKAAYLDWCNLCLSILPIVSFSWYRVLKFLLERRKNRVIKHNKPFSIKNSGVNLFL